MGLNNARLREGQRRFHCFAQKPLMNLNACAESNDFVQSVVRSVTAVRNRAGGWGVGRGGGLETGTK